MTFTPITAPPNNLVHLSSKWADDVCGDHDLRWFDLTKTAADPDTAYAIANHRPILDRHRKTHLIPPFYDHAHYLCPLLMAYDFIQQLGWAEHTSDWDWYVGLQTRDGVWHGDHILTDPDKEDTDEGDYADTFEMHLPDGTPLTPDNMPFELIGEPDPIDYGNIRITLTNCGPFELRNITIVHISER